LNIYRCDENMTTIEVKIPDYLAALAQEAAVKEKTSLEGASIFWVRRAGALGGEQAAIEDWQIKRDGTRRGIVEVTAT
jgi:hypothetical protein